MVKLHAFPTEAADFMDPDDRGFEEFSALFYRKRTLAACLMAYLAKGSVFSLSVSIPIYLSMLAASTQGLALTMLVLCLVLCYAVPPHSYSEAVSGVAVDAAAYAFTHMGRKPDGESD